MNSVNPTLQWMLLLRVEKFQSVCSLVTASEWVGAGITLVCCESNRRSVMIVAPDFVGLGVMWTCAAILPGSTLAQGSTLDLHLACS